MNLARAAALISLVFAASEAAPDSHLHLRISEGEDKMYNRYVAEWGQCQYIDKAYSCQAGLICAVQNQYYGQCVKAVADKWGQCGGKNWQGSCVSGSTCVYQNDYYSQCVPK